MARKWMFIGWGIVLAATSPTWGQTGSSAPQQSNSSPPNPTVATIRMTDQAPEPSASGNVAHIRFSDVASDPSRGQPVRNTPPIVSSQQIQKTKPKSVNPVQAANFVTDDPQLIPDQIPSPPPTRIPGLNLMGSGVRRSSAMVEDSMDPLLFQDPAPGSGDSQLLFAEKRPQQEETITPERTLDSNSGLLPDPKGTTPAPAVNSPAKPLANPQPSMPVRETLSDRGTNSNPTGPTGGNPTFPSIHPNLPPPNYSVNSSPAYIPFQGQLRDTMGQTIQHQDEIEMNSPTPSPNDSFSGQSYFQDQSDDGNQNAGVQGNQFYCTNLFNTTVFVGNNSVGDFQFDRGATNLDSGGFRLKDGVMIGGTMGIYQGRNLRSDLELSYRTNAVETIFYRATPTSPIFEAGLDGDLKVFSGMSNFYWDFVRFPMRWLTPYVGGGVGFANFSSDFNNFGQSMVAADYKTDSNFAYQYMIGANGRLTRDIDLFVEYRYLNSGNIDMQVDYGSPNGNLLLPTSLHGRFDYSSDSVLMGLRIRF